MKKLSTFPNGKCSLRWKLVKSLAEEFASIAAMQNVETIDLWASSDNHSMLQIEIYEIKHSQRRSSLHLLARTWKCSSKFASKSSWKRGHFFTSFSFALLWNSKQREEWFSHHCLISRLSPNISVIKVFFHSNEQIILYYLRRTMRLLQQSEEL